MPECWVFDLDGVLADTEHLVRLAYEMNGVIMPDDAWGKPAREWIPDDYTKVQKRKNETYGELLRQPGAAEMIALPWASIAPGFHELGMPCYVLTGASLAATRMVLECLGLTDIIQIAGTGCTTRMKEDRLRRMVPGHPLGWYIDDKDGVTVPDGWRFIRWTR